MIIKSVKSSNPCKSMIQTSYDIVKTHGGEIKVNSNEDEAGTKFIINIPIKSIQ